LEIIGYFSNEATSQTFSNPILKVIPQMEFLFQALTTFISLGWYYALKKVNAIEALSVYSINAPNWLLGIGFSDHLNYWKNNFPAVMVTDTSFYRNKNYHTAQDTIEKLDYNHSAQIVQFLIYRNNLLEEKPCYEKYSAWLQ
jgi:Peptidase family M28